MDGERFDRLARILGCTSRRGLLGGVIAALIGTPALSGELDAKNNAIRSGKSRKRHRTSERRQKGRRPRSRTSGRVRSQATGPTIDYFALGDSIASGHGLLDTGNGNGQWCSADPDDSRCCRRSIRAHPHKLKAMLTGVQIADFRHLACSGSVVSHLNAQIKEALDFRANNGRNRPMLVTISIGGNDIGLADLDKLYDALYVRDNAGFSRYLTEDVARFSANAESAFKRLLDEPGVYVALIELVNPLNRQSVYFNAPDDDGTMCKDVDNPFASKRPCWDRAGQIIDAVNDGFRDSVAYLQRIYPGRIDMTDGLRDEFAKHWGPPGRDISNCRVAMEKKGGKKNKKGKGKKGKGSNGGNGGNCQPIHKHECGYQPIPPEGDGVTWVQSRTDPESNSFPFRD